LCLTNRALLERLCRNDAFWQALYEADFVPSAMTPKAEAALPPTRLAERAWLQWAYAERRRQVAARNLTWRSAYQAMLVDGRHLTMSDVRAHPDLSAQERSWINRFIDYSDEIFAVPTVLVAFSEQRIGYAAMYYKDDAALIWYAVPSAEFDANPNVNRGQRTLVRALAEQAGTPERARRLRVCVGELRPEAPLAAVSRVRAEIARHAPYAMQASRLAFELQTLATLLANPTQPFPWHIECLDELNACFVATAGRTMRLSAVYEEDAATRLTRFVCMVNCFYDLRDARELGQVDANLSAVRARAADLCRQRLENRPAAATVPRDADANSVLAAHVRPARPQTATNTVRQFDFD
jgi:hypothetical protein